MSAVPRKKEPPQDGERLVPVQIKVPESKREEWHAIANSRRTTLTDLITGLMDGEVEPSGGGLPADDGFRAALGRVRAFFHQAEDGPAVRYCVAAVDKLLHTEEGRRLLFSEIVVEKTYGGGPKKKGG